MHDSIYKEIKNNDRQRTDGHNVGPEERKDTSRTENNRNRKQRNNKAC